MIGKARTEREQPDAETVDQAREGIEQVETGDASGETALDHAREADPASEEAVEQEASDGPEGRGLSR